MDSDHHAPHDTRDGYLRIGELSERVGVAPDLLRAWERRYGLVEPDRTDGGFRLYGDRDVAVVRRMIELLDEGLSAAQAARLARQEAAAPERGEPTGTPDELPGDAHAATVARLVEALEGFDAAAADGLLDRATATYGLEPVLVEVIAPVLATIGDRWAAGDLSVAQEHFASQLVRARLVAAARGWGQGVGPRVVLAGPPGEQHDIGLVAFGLALWRRGARITFLGADTPVGSLVDTVGRLRPSLVVLAGVDGEAFAAVADELASLADETTLAVAGAGASEELADRLGARLLDGDVVTAADEASAILA